MTGYFEILATTLALLAAVEIVQFALARRAREADSVELHEQEYQRVKAAIGARKKLETAERTCDIALATAPTAPLKAQAPRRSAQVHLLPVRNKAPQEADRTDYARHHANLP